MSNELPAGLSMEDVQNGRWGDDDHRVIPLPSNRWEVCHRRKPAIPHEFRRSSLGTDVMECDRCGGLFPVAAFREGYPILKGEHPW